MPKTSKPCLAWIIEASANQRRSSPTPTLMRSRNLQTRYLSKGLTGLTVSPWEKNPRSWWCGKPHKNTPFYRCLASVCLGGCWMFLRMGSDTQFRGQALAPDHQKRLWPSCYQVPIFPAVFLNFKDPSQWFILRIWNSPLIHGIGSMSNVHPISGQNYIHSTLVASLCLMFNPHSCLLNPPFWGQTYIT